MLIVIVFLNYLVKLWLIFELLTQWLHLQTEARPQEIRSLVQLQQCREQFGMERRLLLERQTFEQPNRLVTIGKCLNERTLMLTQPIPSSIDIVVSSKEKLPRWSSSRIVTVAVLFFPISNLVATPPRVWRAPAPSTTLWFSIIIRSCLSWFTGDWKASWGNVHLLRKPRRR